MEDKIILKLKQELVKENFNPRDFFKDYTTEDLEEVKLLAEQMEPLDRVLLLEAIRDLEREVNTRDIALKVYNSLRNARRDETKLDDVINNLVDYFARIQPNLEVSGIALPFKIGYGFNGAEYVGQPRETAYKPLFMIQNGDKAISLTMNLNEGTLAYTVDFGTIRYTESVVGALTRLITDLLREE